MDLQGRKLLKAWKKTFKTMITIRTKKGKFSYKGRVMQTLIIDESLHTATTVLQIFLREENALKTEPMYGKMHNVSTCRRKH